ncbi:unnamed protein product [Arabidopsis lyrata]|uniref:probable RNA 3'-terminal phosphate cyclase-like protein n=1 Tax=Arabidopsis lyrata subsp. lyrata TaxID=81972 RepID=UPI000A29CBA6|nr:probable RNA 3'-terminal phosphate cyclase-like protein [Arabidopsis lyrata subsp. lyrata]CAH8251349.1 unnamed protein product [Arabidopsis lyrata]|eukprot:XP_020866793.1 probable RNA 3'-terminal phosphate cyclase-like protein [Arabidopsis lyrata subsp. lyrata]
MGGKNLVHSCAMSRLVGYYLEPLLVLGLFEKKPLSIRLREALELEFEACGLAQDGGGEALLTVPTVKTLTLKKQCNRLEKRDL